MEPSSTSDFKPFRTGMRSLFGKLLLFLTGLGLILCPLCILSLRADRAALSSPAFRMGKETSVVIAGDSHTETAINPELMPGSVNISLSAENYLYTYFKLKYFLEMNPQIRYVVLGCSPHNVMNHDRNYFQEDRYNRLNIYYMILDSSARRYLSAFRLSYFVAQLKSDYGVPFQLFQNPILVKYLLGKTVFKRYNIPFNGGHTALKGSNLKYDKYIARRVRALYYEGNRYAGASSIDVFYLDKIAALCRERGISLILVDTPLSPPLRRLIPPEATTDFHRIVTGLQRNYPNVNYSDMSSFDLPPEDFYDTDHVNSDGAKVVTAIVAKSIR